MIRTKLYPKDDPRIQKQEQEIQQAIDVEMQKLEQEEEQETELQVRGPGYDSSGSFKYIEIERAANHPDSISYLKCHELAEMREEDRIYCFNHDPKGQLKHLREEIKIQVKITQQAVFKIGELLTYVKNICQEEGIGFKDWISDNCGFSYETANNFMRVNTYCFAQRAIADQIPVSILYKISSPSFSVELRDYLLQPGNVPILYGRGKFEKLVTKYHEGGLGAIEDDIEEINRIDLIRRQTHYYIDQYKNGLKCLKKATNKIMNGPSGRLRSVSMELRYPAQEPEAEKITKLLFTALEKAKDDLERPLKEANQLLEVLYQKENGDM